MERITGDYLRHTRLACVSSSSERRTNPAKLKILLNFITIVSAVNTIELGSSKHLQFFLVDFFGSLPMSIIYRVQCRFLTSTFSKDIGLRLAHFQIINAALLPITLFLATSAVIFLSDRWVIHSKQALSRTNQSVRYAIAFQIILILMIHNVIALIISGFRCRGIGSQRYVIADVSLLCGKESHIQYSYRYFMPAAVLWIAVLFFVWRTMKQNLVAAKNSIRSSLLVGYFTNEFTSEKTVMEFNRMLFKLLITILIFAEKEYMFTVRFIVIALISAHLVEITRKSPYKQRVLNRLDMASSFAQIAVVFLNLLNQQLASIQSLNESTVIAYRHLFQTIFSMIIFAVLLILFYSIAVEWYKIDFQHSWHSLVIRLAGKYGSKIKLLKNYANSLKDHDEMNIQVLIRWKGVANKLPKIRKMLASPTGFDYFSETSALVANQSFTKTPPVIISPSNYIVSHAES